MKKSLLLLAFLLSLTFVHAQVPTNVPTQGLLAWYSFDGNSQDLSGNGNHLTNYNATLVADRYGNPASAYSFNGTSSYLINNTPSYIMHDTSSFTVSVWVYKPTSVIGVFLMHGSTVNGNFIYNIQGTNVVQFGTNKQGSAWFWAQGPITLSTWEHYVGVYQNKVMKLYHNGAYVSTNTFTHTAVSATVLPFHVGRGVSGSYTNGLLDDIGVWNRALSPAEIYDLYSCPTLIQNQPQALNLNILQDAVFSTQATTGVTYQWQWYDGLNYLNIINGGQFSGATTNSLTISNLTLSNDGMSIRCLVSQGICEEPSNLVSLNVQCIPVIALHPVDQIANTWTSTLFAVSAIDPAASYQWQKLSTTLWENLADTGQYTGSATSTLTISSLQLTNNNQQYRCIVALAGCIDTSSSATLTVVSGVGDTEIQAAEQLKIFPNPARETLSIQLAKLWIGATYQIIDATSRIVQTGILFEENQSIHIAELAPGLYVLQLSGNDVVRKKFLIQ